MNRLPKDKQQMVLSLLVEGNSIRSIERITGIHRDTIMRLTVRIAQNCYDNQRTTLRGISCRHIECDEIWTYCGKKRNSQTSLEKRNPAIGDQWVFVAIDRETKLVPAYFVGKRDYESTHYFLSQLAETVKGRFQLTTDKWHGYGAVVPVTVGGRIEYATLSKKYYGDDSGRIGYNPAKLKGVIIEHVEGDPDPDKVCTSYIERQNLTIRTQCKRFTRLTNAFSKKLINLKAAINLHFWHYNFMRQHMTLKCTPAMAAGVAGSCLDWSVVL